MGLGQVMVSSLIPNIYGEADFQDSNPWLVTFGGTMEGTCHRTKVYPLKVDLKHIEKKISREKQKFCILDVTELELQTESYIVCEVECL